MQRAGPSKSGGKRATVAQADAGYDGQESEHTTAHCVWDGVAAHWSVPVLILILWLSCVCGRDRVKGKGLF